MKCFICLQVFSDQAHPHIHGCAKKHKLGLTKIETRKSQFEFTYGKMDGDEFRKLYVEEELSLPDFLKIYEYPYTYTQFLCDYYEIPRRTVKQASTKAHKKSAKTCLDRYGVENPSQLPEIKKKKEDTFQKNYGEKNIFSTEGFKNSRQDFMVAKYGTGSVGNSKGGITKSWATRDEEYRKKVGKYLHEGYTKFWDNCTEEQKQEIIQKRLDTKRINDIPVKHYTSKLEDKVAEILSELGIDYKRQFWLMQKSFDFIVRGKDLVIEVQGDYWHANPLKYPADHIFFKKGGNKTAAEIWGRDAQRKAMLADNGIDVVYIWESEISKISMEDNIRLISEKLSAYFAESDHPNPA